MVNRWTTTKGILMNLSNLPLNKTVPVFLVIVAAILLVITYIVF